MTLKYYGMYTDAGNARIHEIVEDAKANNLSWETVHGILMDLSESDPEKYGEAMDTDVRELVYEAMGAWQRGEYFYV